MTMSPTLQVRALSPVAPHPSGPPPAVFHCSALHVRLSPVASRGVCQGTPERRPARGSELDMPLGTSGSPVHTFDTFSPAHCTGLCRPFPLSVLLTSRTLQYAFHTHVARAMRCTSQLVLRASTFARDPPKP